MKVTINIDMRKPDPFGLDLEQSFQAMKSAYRAADDLGPPNHHKTGWYEHSVAWSREFAIANRLHGLLRIIAAMAGERAAFNCRPLYWATTHDFNGQLRKDAAVFADCYASATSQIGTKGFEE
jgi:hypothetical protein